MKKYLVLILTTIIVTFNMVAIDSTADTKKEEVKFPGIFNFSAIIGGGLDIVDNKINETWYNAPIGVPNGAAYGKTLIAAGLKIPINFYSFKIWAKDDLSIIGKTSDALGPHIRNRFFSGIDNYFSIDKVMNIGINFESRLQAKSSLVPKYPGTNPLDVSSDFDVRLSPVIDLNGSYDFGLSWGISEAFRFYLIPQNDSSKQFDKVQFDGVYYLGYEFLHFTKVPNITGQLYTELDLIVDTYSDTTKETKIYWLEYYLGVNFNIYGFAPSIGFDMTYDNMDAISNGGYLFAGIKAGLGYTKDIYSFNLTYLGNMTSNSNYYSTYYNKTSPVWENHIEAVFGINL
jgi:hypothetical protein